MKPFFSYYGSRWTMARHYTAPTCSTVVEPFAGSSGYSTYWEPETAHLVDLNPDVIDIWRYLIAATPSEIMALPTRVESVADLADLSDGARYLILFWANRGRAETPSDLSPWYFRYRDDRDCKVWGPAARERIASQVGRIKLWTATCGDYRTAPVSPSTHVHVDPPFATDAGRRYRYSDVDYGDLAEWCRSIDAAHVQVCEGASATWLPFREVRESETTRGKRDGGRFAEGVWERSTATLFTSQQ